MKLIFSSLFVFFISNWNVATSQKIEVISPYERGQMMDGVPIGKWSFSDQIEKVDITIDYGLGKVIFNEPDTNSFIVKQGDNWISQKLETPTRLLGSYLRLVKHYQDNIECDYNKEKIIWLIFEVDIDGKAKNPSLKGEYTAKELKNIIAAFNSAPNDWIPGEFNGQKVKSLFSIPVSNCIDECREIEEKLKIKSSDFGKRLVNIGFKQFRKTKPDTSFHGKNSQLYFNQNQIIWSPDDSRILVKFHSVEGTYTQIINATSLTIENTLFAPENYVIKCHSSDCKDLLINYSTRLQGDLIISYALDQPDSYRVLTSKLDVMPVPSQFNESIAFMRKYDYDKMQLCTYNRETGVVNYSKYFKEHDVRPQSWAKENELIIRISENKTQQLEIFDIKSLRRTPLGSTNMEIVAISSDYKKIAIKKFLDITNAYSRLFWVDLEQKKQHQITKSFRNITTVYWTLDSERVIYSNEKGTHSFSIEDKTTNELNKMQGVIISNNRNKIVFTNASDGNLYLSNIDGSNPNLLSKVSVIRGK